LLNGNHITVVGNCSTTGALPTYASATNLTANSYTTNTTGEGYVIQFEYSGSNNPSAYNINNVTWCGRLNGYASDIDVTPDGQHIYITSATDIYPPDTKTVTGAYNLTSLYGSISGNIDFQVSKFTASGVRLWSTLIPMTNSQNTTYNYNSFGNNSTVLTSDTRLKCRIACDNYGFYLAGESNGQVYASISKYGAPCHPWVGGKQAFFARFNKKDSIVYLGQFGGFFDDAFNDIAVLGPNKVVVTGYSTSWDSYQSNLVSPPDGIQYIDTTITHGSPGSYIYPKLYVATFDSVGHRTWGTFYGNNGSGQGCVGWGVTGDYIGRIYVTGKDTGGYTAPIVNPGGVYNQSSTTQSEAFMVCFGFNNNPVWNTPIGGARNEIGLDLEYNATTDYMIIGGITNSNESTSPTFPVYKDASFPSNTWYQGNLNPGNTFYHDGYIGFFKSSVITGIENYYKDPTVKDVFQLFPNPAQSECTLAFKQGLTGKTKIEVYDQLGRLVISEEEPDVLPHNVLSLQTGRLTNGLYIVKVSNEKYTGSQKLIISK
ncbi:MAG: T9SS type A sorting domain-containing protein, partial [Mucilaginibacter sp.]